MTKATMKVHPYLDPKNQEHWWESTNRHVPGYDTRRQRRAFGVQVRREVARAGKVFFLDAQQDECPGVWGICDRAERARHDATGYSLDACAAKLGRGDARVGWQWYWGTYGLPLDVYSSNRARREAARMWQPPGSIPAKR